MRVLKLVATSVAALALFAGTAAVASDLATLQSFAPVNTNPCMTMLCIVPSPQAVGQVCMVSSGGTPVASVVLVPGNNYVAAPTSGWYAASGPGIEASCIHPDNPGIN